MKSNVFQPSAASIFDSDHTTAAYENSRNVFQRTGSISQSKTIQRLQSANARMQQRNIMSANIGKRLAANNRHQHLVTEDGTGFQKTFGSSSNRNIYIQYDKEEKKIKTIEQEVEEKVIGPIESVLSRYKLEETYSSNQNTRLGTAQTRPSLSRNATATLFYQTEANSSNLKRRIQSAARVRPSEGLESKRTTLGHVNASEFLKMQEAFTIDEFSIHEKQLKGLLSGKEKKEPSIIIKDSLEDNIIVFNSDQLQVSKTSKLLTNAHKKRREASQDQKYFKKDLKISKNLIEKQLQQFKGFQLNLPKSQLFSKNIILPEQYQSSRPRTLTRNTETVNTNTHTQSKMTINTHQSKKKTDAPSIQERTLEEIETQFFSGNIPLNNTSKILPKLQEKCDEKVETMALHHGHHLLRTIMKHSAIEADEQAKKTKFMKEYNIQDQNEPYRLIREVHGGPRKEDKESKEKELEERFFKRKGPKTFEQHFNEMKLSNITFDFSKEWPLTRFIHDKLIKDIEEKMFQYHQQELVQQLRVLETHGLLQTNQDGLNEQQDKNREQNLLTQFASNLFAFWDHEKDGYIRANKLAQLVILIGLSPSRDHFYKILQLVLDLSMDGIGKTKITVQDFVKLSQSSRYVNRILKVLNETTTANKSPQPQLIKQTTIKQPSFIGRNLGKEMQSFLSRQIGSISRESSFKRKREQYKLSADVKADMYGARIIGDEEKVLVKRTENRMTYHNRLIILHEILNDVLSFKSLKDPDSAEDYSQKLIYINERRNMISFLNEKYGSGSKSFLEILEIFKSKPHEIISSPNQIVKKLIHETLEKLNKESQTAFKFKNKHLGDMLKQISLLWDELANNQRVDEVLMKDFLSFSLRKHFIADEKELVSMFKDLAGNQSIAEKLYLKRSEFERIFYRSCFKGALQNINEYVDKSSIIMKSQPFSVKILNYQRDLIFAGITSMTDEALNKRGLDIHIVKQNLKEQQVTYDQSFKNVKKELLAKFHRLSALTQTSEANTEIFHPSLKRAFIGDEDGDEEFLMQVIDYEPAQINALKEQKRPKYAYGGSVIEETETDTHEVASRITSEYGGSQFSHMQGNYKSSDVQSINKSQFGRRASSLAKGPSLFSRRGSK